MPPVPSTTRSDVAVGGERHARRRPRRPRAWPPEVTWSSRSWPALAAAPVRPVCTESVPSAGPSVWVPLERHGGAYMHGRVPTSSTEETHMAVELDHPSRRPGRSTRATRDHRSRARRAVRGGGQGGREERRRLREGGDQGQDGRDVDDVHRHASRSSRRTRGAPRGAARQVARGRRPGPRERDGRVRAERRRRDIHTNAQITGKAASMGEGVVVGVLDALIKDFTGSSATM